MASNNRESIKPPREILVGWLARLYRHGLTTTTGGNLSLVDEDGTMYITPSGGDKAIVPPHKIAVRRKGEENFEGPAPPSMEWPLHTAAYQARPGCKAVLHAHSMTLVAFSLAQHTKGQSDESLSDPRLPDTRVLVGAYQACGKVALAPYDLPGSRALADGCRKAFETGADCVILQNHGVVVVGKTMHQAYDRFVSLEYLARSIVSAMPLTLAPKPLDPLLLRFATDLDNESKENPFPKPLPIAPISARIVTGMEKEERSKLCTFVKRAYDQNLITSSSGSFSTRMSRSNDHDLAFVVSPTGVDRRSLEPADLCYISSNPKAAINSEEPKTKVAKTGNHNSNLWFHPVHTRDDPEAADPSRAAAVHGTIYRMHPEIKHVMVVQPPFATSYCITGRPFNSAGIPESHIILHKVQTLPIEAVLKDDGKALAMSFDPSTGRNTVLVEGYGLVTIGKDLLKTFIQVEVCEAMCGVSLTALRRGPVALLSEEQVDDIDKAFNMSH